MDWRLLVRSLGSTAVKFAGFILTVAVLVTGLQIWPIATGIAVLTAMFGFVVREEYRDRVYYKRRADLEAEFEKNMEK